MCHTNEKSLFDFSMLDCLTKMIIIFFFKLNFLLTSSRNNEDHM